MAKRIPIVLGDTPFPTKTAAQARIRGILHGAVPGAPLEPADEALMLAVLERHREAERKIGCGVDYLFVDRAPKHPTKCFWVRRVDGSQAEFSYVECLSPSSPDHLFRCACRSAVRAQIDEFRRRCFGDSEWHQCGITGGRLHISRAHVDHDEPTFYELVVDFMAAESIADPSKVAIGGWEDGQTEMVFEDGDLARRFEEFHRLRARLRVVSAGANLRRARTSGTCMSWAPGSGVA